MLLFPHAKLPDALTLKVIKARLLSSGSSIPVEEDTVSLIGCPLEESHITLHVQVAVSGPEDDINDYLMRHGDISATLTAHCGPSNMRQSVTLAQDGGATQWQGEMELDRRFLRGVTELKAVLTGTQKNRPFRYLGTTTVIKIISDDAVNPFHSGGSLLDIRWADFKAGSGGVLRDNADYPYYVDLTAEPRPKLFLNSSFRGLRELLPQENKPGGVRLPLNEILTISIIRSAIQAMAAAAFPEIRIDDDSKEPTMPEGWQGQIIRELWGELYPGVSDAEKLRKAHDHYTGGDKAAFQSDLLAAINRRLRDGKALRSALKAITDNDNTPDTGMEDE